MLKDGIRKIEEKLKPVNYPEIIVTRKIINRVNGLLCYIGKYEKGRYIKFDFPTQINQIGRK